jgi:charged multivesicular body protein 4
MASWSSWLVGRRENPNAAREAIVGLRQQLIMLDKKEEHLNKKIDEETKKAKAHVMTNKRGEWKRKFCR